MANTVDEKRYHGEEKIVISIDLGTTHSAVSYSYLYPGCGTDVRMVSKWPGQPEASGDCKIPSILAYQNGELKACGAEAREMIGDDEFEIARWFKLHLHPESMKVSDEPPAYGDFNALPQIEIPPLPSGVTIKKVYTDFLTYMFDATRSFFKGSTPNGDQIWNRVEDMIVLVLAMPNGWDTPQQGFLREVVTAAKILPAADLDKRLEFVTEGEASVHYALAHTRTSTWLNEGTMFLVTDAGGSTVDSTLYECKSKTPLVLKEVCASECVQAGGVFVDRAAEILFRQKLGGSKFCEDEYISEMVSVFERKTKRVFNGTQVSNVIDFGRNSDNDRAHDIFKGRFSLTKDEVASAFDDVSDKVANSCLKLLRDRKVQHLLLVGGFGESPYLRVRLKEAFGAQDTQVITIDEPSKKAAAEGASIWYIKQFVTARAVRFTIGIGKAVHFRPSRPDHKAREHLKQVRPNGEVKLFNAFDTWITKDFVIEDNFSKTFGYRQSFFDKPSRGTLKWTSMDILAWEGTGPLEWTRDIDGNRPAKLRTLCTLSADLSNLWPALVPYKGLQGQDYWRVDYKVVVKLDGLRIQAKLQWNEGSKLCEGPVAVIPPSIF